MSVFAGRCTVCGLPRDDCKQAGHSYTPDNGQALATRAPVSKEPLPDGTILRDEDWHIFLGDNPVPYVIVRPDGEVFLRKDLDREQVKAIFRELRQFFA